MPISTTAPIARFGRWLDTLSLGDLFVVGALSPILGIASVVGPAWLSAPTKPRVQHLLRYSIEQFALQPILWLFVSGAIVAVLSRRLGVWAASTVMLGYFVAPFWDIVSGAGGHNLLPFEFGMYFLLTAVAVAGAAMVALVRG